MIVEPKLLGGMKTEIRLITDRGRWGGGGEATHKGGINSRETKTEKLGWVGVGGKIQKCFIHCLSNNLSQFGKNNTKH